MQNTEIYHRRISRFIDRVRERRYGESVPLSAVYTYDKNRPIRFDRLGSRRWKTIEPGTRWGELWASAWFRFTGTVPGRFAGHEVVALIDLGAEGCVFRDGSPYQGLTDVPRATGDETGKRRVAISGRASGGEPVELLVEAAANSLFGHHGHRDFVLRQAELACFDRRLWQLGLDLRFLHELARALPAASVRARRIVAGLNTAANVWDDGAGAGEVARICAGLLKNGPVTSATTAWSVGHAHLDLGWLWPTGETRRKAGRTFSTALRLLEEYPDYVFGTSQPQVLAWVREDYPALYEQIRAAVAGGRWECQGAMWVEPDMNIPSGESLVRQLVHGKRFFRQEFGVDVTNLWLPDVFGYSAALPQLLRLAGVDTFVTQKISWNETNSFPHHTFDWEGIDGTLVRTHFLPANTYNATNGPRELVEAENRFAQADVSNDWLNLYGIGDGGGGPSRTHLEYARRAAGTEGLPRVKLAPADAFFRRIAKLPAHRLPVWRGELYLELHRGTYTTQARLKKLNRRLENALRDTEYLCALSGLDRREELDAIWKETLLNQFHDILPGSSIRRVYEEAEAMSHRNLASLEAIRERAFGVLHGPAPKRADAYVVHNTLSWDRCALVCLPWSDAKPPSVLDGRGRSLPAQPVEGGLLVAIDAPSMGSTSVRLSRTGGAAARATVAPVVATETSLENGVLRVELASDGTIARIYDKEHEREALADGANRLMLWEDLPYSWEAWDISHYYRETTPEHAALTRRRLAESGPLRAAVEQELSVGGSSVFQRIVLEAGSRLVRIENRVKWRESRKQLRVQAIPAVRSLHATYEIQFGTVTRPAHANTSWDAAQFEVAGHRFADYAQADYGFGLVNDCKYGHLIRDGVVELTVLRSPKDPDPEADLGEHEFSFGYYPHALGWEASELLERAHELNAPPLVRAVRTAPDRSVSELAVTTARTPGETGATAQAVASAVKIEVVKQPEVGSGLVLRLYETRGTRRRVVLRSRTAWRSVEEVNLLEEPVRKLGGLRPSADRAFASEIELEFTPYQIRSLRVGH
ncbi:MAG: alpha-mannosidase [Spirochaetota bacterium]